MYAQQSVRNGIKTLEEAVKWLPDNWKLWERLAWYSSMEQNQEPDHAKAAAYYAKAASLPGAPRAYRRFETYQLTRVPEREKEAWDRLMAYYQDPTGADHMPQVDIDLLFLFFERRIQERYPDADLPKELARLFQKGVVLDKKDQMRRAFLIEGVTNRVNPAGIRGKPPVITSPNLPMQR